MRSSYVGCFVSSDERGEFSTTVAPGAKEIDAFVGAPGFALNAGAYTLCEATHSEADASRHGIMFGRPCKTAFLAPYASLELEIR